MSSMQRLVRLLALVWAACWITGCSRDSTPPAVFEPNLVHTMKYQIQHDVPMDEAAIDSTWLTELMFGTPDAPKLPSAVTEDPELGSILSMDRLKRASGPVESGRGLFRKHCVICHGVTGNGRGPTAAVQDPYPRDYRPGIFKFKSTPRGAKPTRDDIARSIREGIGGTAMEPIAKLTKDEITEDDIQALVDYVIYLSWRGQFERHIVDMAILDGIIQDGERVINSDLGRRLQAESSYRESMEQLAKLAESDESELTEAQQEELAAQQEELAMYERYQEDWGYAEEYLAEIGESWLEAEDEVIDVPDPPEGLPLAESYADVRAFRDGEQAAEFNASVQRGQELFVGKVASCSKCHGETGLGNGQTTDYDDWAKDWTVRVGLKPEDRDSLIPLLARGALPPKNAIPRNFAEGVFRGGSNSKDLYRRIMQGIDGTPMPAATFVEGQFEEVDVWHLINFIRSLQTSEQSAMPEPSPAA